MGDFTLPPDYPTIPSGVYDEMRIIKLARHIAQGLKDLGDILYEHGVEPDEYEAIKELPIYKRALESEVNAWKSAGNTLERISLKSAMMIEEFLPEMYARLNDSKEPLIGKMKAVEVAAKLAKAPGFNGPEAQQQINPGDRVHVIINLGADTKAEYIKTLPGKVIDNVPTPQLDPALDENSGVIDASAD